MRKEKVKVNEEQIKSIAVSVPYYFVFYFLDSKTIKTHLAEITFSRL